MATSSQAARASPGRGRSKKAVWDQLAELTDPEIPILTLEDLGILRWVRVGADRITVGIAPTYSGCPALEVIELNVVEKLKNCGYAKVKVERVLAPPWTTDWISDAGRKKLLDYGIAPPAGGSRRTLLGEDLPVACPRCASSDTAKVSEFGSTPCKASYKCNACLEPFEYFKCI
ncbi:MAG: phenylacetate-CoA oxygenase subunit PaaJ [Gammaproteobacteria bacterium]|nr:phenylacetate-CoA oxygenase subunit PaaJ [Gammaproteobacteria bacterium]